ncbi:hypothetical protein [Streptomyces sp. NBC_01207]|uniref:hypothetical protein n=1 Tax=Streptomyces sp. NBC_01207 TaxID=2903772 RepID=UPI002E13CEB0|nr:hypothetical protein OG457_49480 [Streptomyces sp. NBC_01207]
MTHAERIRYKRRQDAAYQAGEDAVTNLQAALALAGMTLPSLSNDGPVAGHGFVRLGACNAVALYTSSGFWHRSWGAITKSHRDVRRCGRV